MATSTALTASSSTGPNRPHRAPAPPPPSRGVVSHPRPAAVSSAGGTQGRGRGRTCHRWLPVQKPRKRQSLAFAVGQLDRPGRQAHFRRRRIAPACRVVLVVRRGGRARDDRREHHSVHVRAGSMPTLTFAVQQMREAHRIQKLPEPQCCRPTRHRRPRRSRDKWLVASAVISTRDEQACTHVQVALASS